MAIEEVQKEELGKIQTAAQSSPPPPPQAKVQVTKQSKITPDLLAEIRKKLISKNQERDININGSVYSLKVLNLKDLYFISQECINKYQFDKKAWYDKTKTLFEQIKKADPDDFLIISSAFISHALKKIDGLPVEQVFDSEEFGSKDWKQNLFDFVSNLEGPGNQLFQAYSEIKEKDVASEEQVKN